MKPGKESGTSICGCEAIKITKSFAAANPADRRNWLAKNRTREQEVWLIYLKATSGRTHIHYKSLVEEALRFVWIDRINQKIDDEKYTRKFNPRRLAEAGMARVTFDVSKMDISKPKPRRPPAKIPEKIEKARKSCPEVWKAFRVIVPSLQGNYVLWLSGEKTRDP